MPPIKLYDQGRLNEEALRLFAHNTRAPKEVEADIKAIAAGTAAGAARVRRAVRALRQGHLPRGLRRDPEPHALGASSS